MPQLSNSQARVIDPILTEVARGYVNSLPVGQLLFPRVPVSQRGGRIITFGKEDFMLYNNLQRAPGQNTKRVQFGYAGAAFALLDYSLEGQVPIETQQEAEAVPGIDLAQRTIVGVQNIMANRLEIAQAALATNAANYGANNKVTLAGTAQWSDTSGVSDPFADIEAGKESIRSQTGQYPTTMVIGPKVFSRLKVHPKIVGRLQYTTTAIATEEILAALFDIPQLKVGRAVYATDAGQFVDAWGKDVVMAYTPIASLASQGTPSYGYTYQLTQMPLVEEPYADRNAKSWLYPVDDAVAPVIAGAESGYVIKGAVA